MPESTDEARQRRHDDANRDQSMGAEPYVRRIASEEATRINTQAWNDVGVDFATFQGKSEHARLLDYMRERYRDRERIGRANDYATEMLARKAEVDEALAFIRDLKAAGKAGKKNVWTIIVAALSAAATGAIGALFATRGH